MSRTRRSIPHWVDFIGRYGKGPGLDYRGKPLVRNATYNGRDGRAASGVSDAYGDLPRCGYREITDPGAKRLFKRLASKTDRRMAKEQVQLSVADMMEEAIELQAEMEMMDEMVLIDGGYYYREVGFEPECELDFDDPWDDRDYDRACEESDDPYGYYDMFDDRDYW